LKEYSRFDFFPQSASPLTWNVWFHVGPSTSSKYPRHVKRRDLYIVVPAMVVVAAGAVVASHYTFSSPNSAMSTSTTALPANIRQAYRACVADGATLSTAIAAFDAQNPGLVPTEKRLTFGTAASGYGAYLQNWAFNPNFYNYSLKNGVLYLQPGADGFLSIVPPPGLKFTGPKTCRKIGL
jgi:hypothetical protein